MNISDMASLLAALGSCAAALATWRIWHIVAEIKWQREISWRPDITCIFPVLTTGEDAPCLRLRNVGFGVAKDVIVKLSIPLERILPAVNEVLRNEGISLIREDGQVKICRPEEGGIACEGFSLSCSAFTEHLLPGGENTVEMRLPAYLLPLLELAAEWGLERDNAQMRDVLRGVTLEADIRFFDMGGVPHQRKRVFAFFGAVHDIPQGNFVIRFK